MIIELDQNEVELMQAALTELAKVADPQVIKRAEGFKQKLTKKTAVDDSVKAGYRGTHRKNE